MSLGKIILTTVLTTLTALFFTAVVAASFLPGGAQAHGFGKFGGSGIGRHGSHRGGPGRMLAHCEHLSPAHTRVMQAAISAGLDLSDAQEAALAPIIDVVDGLREQVQASCKTMPPQDVDAGLATMQNLLQDSANALADIRPAYANFYASLTADQQAHIDGMVARHQAHGADPQ